MKETEFKEIALDYVLGKLDEDKRVAFEKFLQENPQYEAETNMLQSIYKVAIENEVPEPSERMDNQFKSFLAAEISAHKKTKTTSLLVNHPFWHFLSVKQIAFSAMVLILGVLIGNQLNRWDNQSTDDLASMEITEVQQVRSQLVMALIDQPSANKRLQGIDEASKLHQITDIIINALFKTLNNDPNTNVRLAAVGSLANYTDNPKVREQLVQSITKQISPMVQIALAELMVNIQEKSSVDSMKEMILNPDININAKRKFQESIDILI